MEHQGAMQMLPGDSLHLCICLKLLLSKCLVHLDNTRLAVVFRIVL